MKSIKFVVILVMLSVGLGGCLHQDISKYEIDIATKFCEDKGGIFEMTATFGGNCTVICGDGTKEWVGTPLEK